MSQKTKIQWCDSTVNPGMGCDGCELWPTIPILLSSLVALVLRSGRSDRETVRAAIDSAVNRYETPTEFWHGRKSVIDELALIFPEVAQGEWAEEIEKHYKCYAGVQHLMRGGSPENWSAARVAGFAPNFDRPALFPGRMAIAAGWMDLAGHERPTAPWLNDLPRLVFVSDMGDALSASVPFDFLKEEIIDNVRSPKGMRHIWLWLTKRPARMAEFAAWLETHHSIVWPDNLVAMTSITNRATRSRIGELRRVPAKFRGLSVEPLVESVELDLIDINWVIIGGESGKNPREFDIEWARSVRDQCHEAGVAFFVKQLGANVAEEGFPIALVDSHGGDWTEWPGDLRVRNFPAAFRPLSANQPPSITIP